MPKRLAFQRLLFKIKYVCIETKKSQCKRTLKDLLKPFEHHGNNNFPKRGKFYDGDVGSRFLFRAKTNSLKVQTQLQTVPILSLLYPSVISFSSFTFPGAPYQIFLLFHPWLPCHFYLVVITSTTFFNALISLADRYFP